MATIKPFKATRYNPKKIKDIAQVIAPPYDVISKEAQLSFQRKSPYNIIRLILSRQSRRGDKRNNRYKRAAATLQKWLKQEILISDETPGIYFYRQKYLHKNKWFIRSGFFARVKIESLSRKILPHERTYRKPKTDRLRLLKATKANLSPVFGLYGDPDNRILSYLKPYIRTKPLIEISDKEGMEHRLWYVKDKDVIDKLSREIKRKRIYIADGHHRYEAGRLYARSNPAANFIMMCLVSIEDKGLIILPTHRVVETPGLDIEREKGKLNEYFRIKELPLNKKRVAAALRREGKEATAFGLYYAGRFFILKLRSKKTAGRFIKKGLPVLDVTILHKLILESILKLDISEDKIVYTADEEEAVRLAESGKGKIAFFLNPVKMAHLEKMALKGEKMPHKSTYFYPKLPSGLVINRT